MRFTTSLGISVSGEDHIPQQIKKKATLLNNQLFSVCFSGPDISRRVAHPYHYHFLPSTHLERLLSGPKNREVPNVSTLHCRYSSTESLDSASSAMSTSEETVETKLLAVHQTSGEYGRREMVAVEGYGRMDTVDEVAMDW